MAIPTALDYKMSKIDDLAASVVVALRIMRHNPSYDARQVRERLQLFVDAVTEAANGILADR